MASTPLQTPAPKELVSALAAHAGPGHNVLIETFHASPGDASEGRAVTGVMVSCARCNGEAGRVKVAYLTTEEPTSPATTEPVLLRHQDGEGAPCPTWTLRVERGGATAYCDGCGAIAERQGHEWVLVGHGPEHDDGEGY